MLRLGIITLLITVCWWAFSAPPHPLIDPLQEADASPVLQGMSVYMTQSGHVSFTSDAPLENISANSDKLKGAIDTAASSFAFSVDVSSFDGFNSALQREHFNENYLESEKFPTASFSGRIIERIQYDLPGTYQVRAKGYLNIHGTKRERIIPIKVVVSESGFRVTAAFILKLEDHNIKIPRIVYEKIAPEIQITVHAELKPAV